MRVQAQGASCHGFGYIGHEFVLSCLCGFWHCYGYWGRFSLWVKFLLIMRGNLGQFVINIQHNISGRCKVIGKNPRFIQINVIRRSVFFRLGRCWFLIYWLITKSISELACSSLNFCNFVLIIWGFKKLCFLEIYGSFIFRLFVW